MRFRFGRPRVPDEVRAAIALHPAERVLSATHSAGDTYLVASNRALYVVTPPQATRLRWDLVDLAVWEPPALALRVRPDEQSPPESRSYPVDRTGDLPAVVRDRVENSIIVNSRVDVTGGHARVVARRHADTGVLRWRVVFGEGVDPTDPQVQAAAAAELADLRARLGV